MMSPLNGSGGRLSAICLVCIASLMSLLYIQGRSPRIFAQRIQIVPSEKTVFYHGNTRNHTLSPSGKTVFYHGNTSNHTLSKNSSTTNSATMASVGVRKDPSLVSQGLSTDSKESQIKKWLSRDRYTYCRGGSTDCASGNLTFNLDLIHKYGIDDIANSLISIKNMSLEEFKKTAVFVTGASSNHFGESIAALESLQKQVRPLRVEYWDLGLTNDELDQLKSICGLNMHTFNRTKYPPHVANLQTYAFKPLITMETLKSHSAVIWFDTSVRFPYKEIWEKTFEEGQRRDGVLHYLRGHVFPYRFTDPHMYQYFPTNLDRLRPLKAAGEGGLFMYAKTERAFKDVLYWAWLCALTQDCIAPSSATQHLAENKHLHRFDQSMMGILNENEFQFAQPGYVIPKEYALQVRRGQGKAVLRVKWCRQA